VFTYEIVRPHAVESPPTGHVRSIIQQARNTALALVQQRAPNPTPDQDGFIRQNGRMYMDKVPYTKWLEGSVRGYLKGAADQARGHSKPFVHH
jgi:hypothetical protein